MQQLYIADPSAHRVQGFFGKGVEATHNATVARKAADINIFTVASGLLYEVRRPFVLYLYECRG